MGYELGSTTVTSAGISFTTVVPVAPHSQMLKSHDVVQNADLELIQLASVDPAKGQTAAGMLA